MVKKIHSNQLRLFRQVQSSYKKFRCIYCSKTSDSNEDMLSHVELFHCNGTTPQPPPTSGNSGVPVFLTTAINKYFKVHRFTFGHQIIDPFDFRAGHVTESCIFINSNLLGDRTTPIGVCFQVRLVTPLNNDMVERFFNTILFQWCRTSMMSLYSTWLTSWRSILQDLNW